MNERIAKVLSHKVTIPATIGVVTFGVGFGIGYILAKRKKFELHVVPDLMDLEEVPEPRLVEDEEDEEVYPVDERHLDVVAGGETILIDEVDPSDEEPIRKNVFAQTSTDVWDFEEELKNRRDGEPYILHQDEFFQSERDWTQLTLTYFEGDDIMIDQEEKLIYNYAQKVGELRFGHGSNDPNVFYVRNDKYRAEYEILRHEGLYSVEIQGLVMEEAETDLRHSSEKLRD